MFVLIAVVIVGAAAATPKPDLGIIGGHMVDIKERPWQISVWVDGRFECGGSILSEEWVMTAASCCYEYSQYDRYIIRAGSNETDTGGFYVRTDRVVPHPDYIDLKNDICLMHLYLPLHFGGNIQPIDLPDEDEDLPEGVNVTLSGWGLTHEGPTAPAKYLHLVEMPVINHETCAELYAHNIVHVDENMFCTGILGIGGVAPCKGDGGGAAVYNGKAVGISSWEVGCAEPNNPSVYTLVHKFRKWIDETIGK